MIHHPTRRSCLISLATLAVLPGVRAQDTAWPQRPITIYVPSAAGGAADFVARTWAQYMEHAIAKSVVLVDDRPGAGGILGTMVAKKAPADGYAFLISTNSTHAANGSLYANLPYDPQNDFEPVGLFGKFSTVLMVSSSSPYKTLPELIQFAKANVGKLTFGYYSSSSRVPPELLKTRAQIDCLGVPYKNITQIITDLLGGQINFAFLDMLSAAPALANDRLRALAVTSPTREPSLPNVATVAEVLPGYAVQGWIGLHAPAGTPKTVIERVSALMLQAVSDVDFKKALEGRGMVVGGMSASKMPAFIAEDVTRWTKWIHAAGIQPQ